MHVVVIRRDVYEAYPWVAQSLYKAFALATFLRYHHEQGLSRRPLRPEELFAPEATESAVI